MTRPVVVCAAPPRRLEGSLAALHRRAQVLDPRQRVVEIALATPLAQAIPAAVVSGEWFGMWMSKQWNGCATTVSTRRVPRTDAPVALHGPTGLEWTSGRLPASPRPAINRGWIRIAGFTIPSAPFAHGRKPPRPAPAAGRSRRARSCSTSRCSNGSCAI
ncbi:DUF2165 family protein [Burkholderia sp. MS455]|uniref:DUF2165 family protein n=1 Tax=Burkholderia TaxID=32008 RepID=UPI00092FF3CA|nr:DUF2165 family protein [Burkholderia sp. MS455]